MVHHIIISRSALVLVRHACVDFDSLRALAVRLNLIVGYMLLLACRFLARREKQLDAVKKSVTFQTCCEQELEPQRVEKKEVFVQIERPLRSREYFSVFRGFVLGDTPRVEEICVPKGLKCCL